MTFKRKIPTRPGFYWVVREGEPTIARLDEGGDWWLVGWDQPIDPADPDDPMTGSNPERGLFGARIQEPWFVNARR